MAKSASKKARVPIFPRGAEWRQWDLHVHAPSSKFGDGYGNPAPWDEYCKIIETSDVAVFGITDYFSLDAYFAFLAEHKSRYPESKKVFFPNLELRLHESVNNANELVHVHLLFRPDVGRKTIDRLLATLPVMETEASGRRRTCSELSSEADYESATVTREGVHEAIRAVFGDKEHARECVLILVPANNDGVRASKSQRKRQIADEIEKDCHALFGNPTNRDYYLDPDRYEADVMAVPKPVFAGSDAHSIRQLKDWLGKTVQDSGQSKHITWIKADPTFEGLQQTLFEPAERVRIQPTIPDAKDPYKVIRSISFSGTNDFPAEIELNQNLVSVIGSRSSGKSALLAYIAYAVDPEATLREQQAVAPPDTRRERLGPAAAIAWDDVAHIKCTVHWAQPSEHNGQVIFIPQNSLYEISQRPREITEKIEPTVFRLDPAFQLTHETAGVEIGDANSRIREAVARWFELAGKLTAARQRLREIGDREAIEQTQADLASKIEDLRQASSLNKREISKYQKLTDRLNELQARLVVIDEEARQLASFLVEGDGVEGTAASYELSPSVRIGVSITPAATELPDELEVRVHDLMAQSKASLTNEIETLLSDRRSALAAEQASIRVEDEKLRTNNVQLIAKNAANAEIETHLASKRKQDEALEKVKAQNKRIESLSTTQGKQVELIEQEIKRRDLALNHMKSVFTTTDHSLQEMTFGLEQQHDKRELRLLAERFNQHRNGPFIDRKEDNSLKIDDAQREPGGLLRALLDGEQKVMKGEDPQGLAADVLALTQRQRFFAKMEGDRIGGFQDSSMTPGKQALFALTLILNESDDAWPLLIDQPEDDLDSRSVYDVLVGYLVERKKERQIIMVSHNANLVIGADSEQVVVANRHGDDRRNPKERQFAYRSGSLEHSETMRDIDSVLDSCGIREHACGLLDGGEEAFRKRRAKYKL